MASATDRADSVFSDEDDYDVISNPGQQSDLESSLESSLADLKLKGQRIPTAAEICVYEPRPLKSAEDKFDTVSWTAKSIQDYVTKSLGANAPPGDDKKLVRVYVDGIFNGFGVGDALQLRQAKLSFPHVKLIVGVFSDSLCTLYGYDPPHIPHVERCEMVRHCRWVDEVMSDVPWQLDAEFVRKRKIDFVAVNEGTSVDPACDKMRVKGYDEMKSLGKVIPTRRTSGLTSVISPSPTTHFLIPTTPRSPAPPLVPTPTLSPPPPPPPHPLLSEETPEPVPQMDIYGIGF